MTHHQHLALLTTAFPAFPCFSSGPLAPVADIPWRCYSKHLTWLLCNSYSQTRFSDCFCCCWLLPHLRRISFLGLKETRTPQNFAAVSSTALVLLSDLFAVLSAVSRAWPEHTRLEFTFHPEHIQQNQFFTNTHKFVLFIHELKKS